MLDDLIMGNSSIEYLLHSMEEKDKKYNNAVDNFLLRIKNTYEGRL